MPDQQIISAYERLFLAMSDKTRLRLLVLMANGPVSVGYLARQLGESQPKTSRHLAYLRNAGLVTATREGKWIYYQIEEQSVAAANSLLSVILRSIDAGEMPSQLTFEAPAVNGESNISAITDMSEWEPNQLDIHLL